MVELRNAESHELEALQNFLTTHGANQWNYLPEDGIDQQFQRLYKGTDYCLVAIDGGHPVGIAVYSQCDRLVHVYSDGCNHPQDYSECRLCGVHAPRSR